MFIVAGIVCNQAQFNNLKTVIWERGDLQVSPRAVVFRVLEA